MTVIGPDPQRLRCPVRRTHGVLLNSGRAIAASFWMKHETTTCLPDAIADDVRPEAGEEPGPGDRCAL